MVIFNTHRKWRFSFLALLFLFLAIGSITLGAITYSASKPNEEQSPVNSSNRTDSSSYLAQSFNFFSSNINEFSVVYTEPDVTFTVNNTGDTNDISAGDGICADSAGNCTLRAAIQESNATPATDSIVFSVTTPATIQLNSTFVPAELIITKAVTITGPGARLLTVRGNANTTGGIFTINTSVGAGTVNISGLTIADSGGRGVTNDATLNLNDAVIKGNTFGIYNTKDITLNRVLIHTNTNSGIFTDANSTAIISNTTITNNASPTNGGGVQSLSANVTLNNVTISHNTATTSGGGFYYNKTASGINVRNTIIALNTAPTGPDILSVESANGSIFNSRGNNLIGKSQSSLGFVNGTNGDKVGTPAAPLDPLLGPLQNNGGIIDTRALLDTSPARDAGNNCVTNSSCPNNNPQTNLTTDARGTNFPRSYNSVVDMGAFESFYPVAAITSFAPSNWGTGRGAFELTINGMDFVANSQIKWNGNDRATTFVSNTQIKAQILAGDVASAGQTPVTVVNPTPGGGASPALNFTVADCTYSIDITSQTFTAAGGTSTINVTTPHGCQWTATNNTSFATINSGTSGTGPGAVNFTVPANTGLARNGTLTIAGLTFTINQDNGCTYTLNPTSANHTAGAGNYSFALTTSNASCTWTVSDDAPWITVTNTSGSNSATINYSVTANTGASRNGTITVTGMLPAQTQNFPVTQASGCTYTLNPTSQNFAAAGANGSFSVTTDASCSWTAVSNSGWITVNSGSPGNGNGTVAFTVAANTGPARSGKITVNGQDFNITQDSGCTFSLSATSANIVAAGSASSVNVIAGAGCDWTATSNAAWITISSGTPGSGNGTVNFTVAANNGLARTGTLTIAGLTFTVNQDNGCTYSLNPTSQNFSSAAGNGNFALTTSNSNCTWTATASDAWINVTSGSGSGSGTVNFSVIANAGVARTGTITLTGAVPTQTQTFTANQASGCTYIFNPTSATHPAGAGSYSFALTTSDPSCAWTATDDSSWITVTNTSGTGGATINYSLDANTGLQRTGKITINSQDFNITQSNGCTFTFTPASANFPAAGAANNTFNLTASNAACTWTATTNDNWITINSGTPGTGNGTINYTIAANTGPQRNGKITVGANDFNITQNSGCTYSINPTSASPTAAGGNGSFSITTPNQSCAWTAAVEPAAASWLSISSGTSGTGNGTINYTVAANNGLARTGKIIAGGQEFTVNQANGCVYTLTPASRNYPNTGATGSTFAVGTSNQNCTWTATRNDNWLTITNGTSGTGNGTVTFDVAANAGVARTGTITVAGAVSGQNVNFTANQAIGCTYNLSAASGNFPAGGGAGSFDVTTTTGCGWTAASSAPWVTVNSGTPGSGNGTINFSVAANAGLARTATITVTAVVTGQTFTFTVNQANGCTYTLTPTSFDAPNAGGSGSFSVATSDQTCTWTAAVTPANSSWVSITSGTSGTGNGTVNYNVSANNGLSRTGTIVVSGAVSGQNTTFTINQSNGCIYTLTPTSGNYPNTATNGATFAVGTSNTNCTWTATTSNNWITIVNGTGTGNGNVTFSLPANAGVARTGTITVTGAVPTQTQTFTVNQASGCTYSLNPTSATHPAGGGNFSFALTTSDPTCSWTAADDASWITVTNTSGNGNATINYSVDANNGMLRSGTITISATVNGQTVTQNFSVNQSNGCVYTLTPANRDFTIAGGTSDFALTTSNQNCTWTATKNGSWINITSPTTGTGNATIAFSVDANNGLARTGNITVTGAVPTQTVSGTVNQSNGCVYTLTPTSGNYPNTASTQPESFAVGTSNTNCTWTATTSAPWITIVNGTGTGGGNMTFNLSANTGPQRTGTITVTGAVPTQTQTFTVTQASGCSYALSPVSTTFGTSGGSGSFNIIVNTQTCAWTASTTDNWITLVGNSNGTGNGSVSFAVQANVSPQRMGKITIREPNSSTSRDFEITQDNGCNYSISPTNLNVQAAGVTSSFNVNAGAGCTWTAVSSQPSWLTINSGTPGNGSGTINFTVAANTGLVRTATITVTGATGSPQIFTVNQDNGCIITLTPASRNHPSGSSTGNTVAVSTSAPGCTWTAAVNPTTATWVSITGGASGTGGGTITYSLAANTGPQRTARITVSGQADIKNFDISQDDGCTYTLVPTSTSISQNGGTRSFNVTASAAGCTWTAVSNAPTWITITSGSSGTGNGTVNLSIAANSGADRMGTVSVNGANGQSATFTVNQVSLLVTNLNDSGAGSLRQAILNANSVAGNDVITFQQNLFGGISLTTGEIKIEDGVEIRGPGADRLQISGSNNSRIFYVNNVSVTISGLTLTAGNGVGLGSTASNRYGGAIYVYGGSLTLDSVHVTGNTITVPIVQGNSGIGGGIYYFGGENHEIKNSTISNNSCTFGAGYYNQNGTMTISNSTFTLNVARDEGGAIYSVGDTTIRNATIADNSVVATGDKGGGIFIAGGNLNLGNTILSRNTGPELTFYAGNFVSAGHNLVGDMPGDAANTKNLVIYHPTDIKDTPPMIVPMLLLGGKTPTMGVLPGSPVINAGDNALSVSQTDQRGATRIINGTVDIGAFEYIIVISPTSPNLQPATIGQQYYADLEAARAENPEPVETFEFFLIDGFLPPWAHITQDGGLITGFPDSGGVFEFTIKAVGGNDGMAGVNKYILRVNCSYTINPTSRSAPAGGESNTVSVTAVQGCTWTVTVNNANPWITAQTQGGSGNGTVNYTVAANNGPARSGTMTIGGQTFTVNQDNGCIFALSPNSADNLPAGGSSGSFNISTVGGCGWTATSNAPSWLSITSGANGIGNGTVNYTVAANTGLSRTATITVNRPGGTPVDFTVTQQGGCSYTLPTPANATIPTGGGNGSFVVTTTNGCSWTASINPPTATWLTITPVGNDTGPGRVDYTVAPNAGPRRTAVINVMGQTYTINQNGASIFDFDGDGKADPAVFRPSDSGWYLLRSQAGFTGTQFGISTDKIAPADFDGDGKTDIAVFRDGNWYLLRSQLGFTAIQFGAAGDLPRPADFDGDGKADVCVFRPSAGAWYRLNSSDGQFVGLQFGANGDIPFPVDFDGDRKADLNVFRRSDGGWYRLNSSNGQFVAQQFGIAEDIPAPADFDGDGKADITVFRPSNGGWYRLNSSNGAFIALQFGTNGDKPAVGDFDGDGKADIAVFRPSIGSWFWLNSSNGAFTGIQFGANGDAAIPAYCIP